MCSLLSMVIIFKKKKKKKKEKKKESLFQKLRVERVYPFGIYMFICATDCWLEHPIRRYTVLKAMGKSRVALTQRRKL